MSDADGGRHSASVVPESFTADDEDFFGHTSANAVPHDRSVGSGEPDEYGNYDLADMFTRKELAKANKWSAIIGGHFITHERIAKGDNHPGVNFQGVLLDDKSPYSRYRAYDAHLTVSADLAGPAWYVYLILYDKP